MFNFEEKPLVSSYSITIRKILSPEVKHSIYRKYKNLAHPPEGIWVEASAFRGTKSALIGKDGALSDFHIDKKLFKICGITAEDVDIELKFFNRIKLKTPRLAFRIWENEANEKFINELTLFNSVLSAKDDGKLVWSVRLSGLNGTSRVLFELLKMTKECCTFQDNLKNLLIKVKPVSITPHLPTVFPTSKMSMPQETVYFQKITSS